MSSGVVSWFGAATVFPPLRSTTLGTCSRAEEWPPDTALAGYLESVTQVVMDPNALIFLSQYQGALQVGFIRRSGALLGPAGHYWVLVEYRVREAHWVTAY